jgi:hypothetical protein
VMLCDFGVIMGHTSALFPTVLALKGFRCLVRSYTHQRSSCCENQISHLGSAVGSLSFPVIPAQVQTYEWRILQTILTVE